MNSDLPSDTIAGKAPDPEFGTRQCGIDYIDRPGVYAVIQNNHSQIAVIETRNGYFLPGGGVDPGESDADALQRELLEEIGYQASIVAEIGGAIEYIQAYSYEAGFIKYNLALKLEKTLKRITASFD